jgi:hypothetical protein
LAVWYLGNIYYNIYNKKACIALGKNAAGASNAHWALSAVQVSDGRGRYEERWGEKRVRGEIRDRERRGTGGGSTGV